MIKIFIQTPFKGIWRVRISEKSKNRSFFTYFCLPSQLRAISSGLQKILGAKLECGICSVYGGVQNIWAWRKSLGMPRARPRKYKFPSNTPSTGGLKIWPFGLNLLMKLKFQRSFWNQNGQISYKNIQYQLFFLLQFISNNPPPDPVSQEKVQYCPNFRF